MPNHTTYQLQSGLKVWPLRGGGALLVTEREEYVVRDAVMGAVLARSHVPQTRAGLETTLQQNHSIESICEAFDTLQTHGILVKQRAASVSDEALYWTALSNKRTLLPPAAVRLASVGGVEVEALRGLLEREGVRVHAEGALQVILTDSYQRPEVARLAEQRWRAGQHVLLARPVGTVLWLGPFIVPGRSGCIPGRTPPRTSGSRSVCSRLGTLAAQGEAGVAGRHARNGPAFDSDRSGTICPNRRAFYARTAPPNLRHAHPSDRPSPLCPHSLLSDVQDQRACEGCDVIDTLGNGTADPVRLRWGASPQATARYLEGLNEAVQPASGGRS